MTGSTKGTGTDLAPADRGQLADIVGAGGVFDDPAVLSVYSRDMSFAPAQPPSVVVKPADAGQVHALVQWANQALVTLVPVSSGAPHLRGDTLPQQGGVVVDLSEMKGVLRVDRRNRVAMIEPGVTFADLKPEVENQGMRVMTPLAPRSTKSIIGGYLEREPTLVPRYHWDMSDPLCCTEVVFGSGDLFRTGAAAGPGTLEEQWESGQAQKSPLGPGPTDFHRVIQGAQGTLGIVTWATIRLELLPSMREVLMIGCEKLEEITDFVHWLQRLKLGDECLVLDRLNLASILEQGAHAIEELCSTLPPYVLILVVAGYERFPEERVAYQIRDVMALAQRSGVNPERELPGVDTSRLLEALSGPCPDPYWKLRFKGNCADILFLTTLDRASDFIRVMRDSCRETGFPEANMGAYVQPIQQGRSCHMEFNLTFDPASDAEVDLTKKTFESASRDLLSQGAFFSRPYGTWAELLRAKIPEHVGALRKVKGIFDPNSVMNPGKLFF
jgi:FAD/FMN-containing dehydrogenase